MTALAARAACLLAFLAALPACSTKASSRAVAVRVGPAQPVSQSVTITVGVTGGGKVEILSTGGECASACPIKVVKSTAEEIQVAADSPAGLQLVKYVGCDAYADAPTDSICIIYATANKSVTAVFSSPSSPPIASFISQDNVAADGTAYISLFDASGSPLVSQPLGSIAQATLKASDGASIICTDGSSLTVAVAASTCLTVPTHFYVLQTTIGAAPGISVALTATNALGLSTIFTAVVH
jgi:hypothetical protein